MKVMKTVERPAKTETVLDYVQCDLCKATSKREDWSLMQYEVNEPEVSLRVGNNYPEGGDINTTVLDICPKCFEEKLVPWFKSQGGTPRVENHDW